jgi:cytochrome c oxidase subunit 2
MELANEIRLPVGERVAFHLESPDVIHSFWIPALSGKMDMIPGRQTRLALEPTRTGVFRGACAEYCGTSHALMSFDVVVLEPADFARWLEQQRAPAQPPVQPLAVHGQELFLANGCGACHTVRGTPADGVVGPDLTHVGSRLSLGAATLSNDPEAFQRWVANTDHVKPGVHMPAFGMLPPEDLRALAAYLDALQ